MAQNVGTLVAAAIRPNDSLDPIASAFATEIKGGLHTATSSSDRDAIIFQRREWGMMCYVINDNKTYQLTYGYIDNSIMNNSNWKEFSGSGGGSGGGGSEWIDSVISFENIQPIGPSNGDRYILGTSPIGASWSSLQPGLVVQWSSTTSRWNVTTPTEGMSVRVDSEENSIYKFEGTFGSGGTWVRDKMTQIRSISPTTTDNKVYTAISSPPFDGYMLDMIILTKFPSSNVGVTFSINVNNLGEVFVKKVTKTGLTNFQANEISTSVVYNLTYDGTFFQLVPPPKDDIFNVKYYIEPTDYIVVPQYYQYWIYGDLEIAGTLVNYGHVIISNGSLTTIGSGAFSNGPSGQLIFASLMGGATASYNDSDTIQFSYQNTVAGPSVSAIVKDGSLTASKLDTGSNGGATAGYLLSVDDDGNFSWVIPSSLVENSTDDKNFIVTYTTVGNGYPTGLAINSTPLGHVGVYINGVETDLGYGSTVSSSCYFSNDGGTTAKNIGNILSGDILYWNTSAAGFSLSPELPDRISLYYIV
jgi:hypothetical protein